MSTHASQLTKKAFENKLQEYIDYIFKKPAGFT